MVRIHAGQPFVTILKKPATRMGAGFFYFSLEKQMAALKKDPFQGKSDGIEAYEGS
jgi:hypothetical protein